MPVKQAYQEFLDETIRNLHQGQRLDVQTILCQVFESLMESERAVFLNESLDNKGNGFYSRFINHLQGRFEIKIPRDRRGQFYPLTLEIIKQDSARMDQLALSLYSQGVSHRGVSHILMICLVPIIALGNYRNWSKHLSRYGYPGSNAYFHHTITSF